MDYITNDSEITTSLEQDKSYLYFYASWMPYHKKMDIMIGKIESEFNIKFNAIDVDQLPTQCKRFNIESIPHILLFKNGKKKKSINGVILTSALRSLIREFQTK